MPNAPWAAAGGDGVSPSPFAPPAAPALTMTTSPPVTYTDQCVAPELLFWLLDLVQARLMTERGAISADMPAPKQGVAHA